jgi:tRNA(fMet)-specific endonuclease VapC
VSLPFDDRAAIRCAQIRNALERVGMRIGPHDLQIAAIALEHGLTLVTHNSREFNRIGGLKVEDWEA